MSNIVIVTAADENYAHHLAVMMASIVAQNVSGSHITFYVLDGGLSNQSKARLNLLKETHQLDIFYVYVDNNQFNHFPVTDYFTSTTYYRIGIPDFIDQSINKVLYLDCDIMARTDLSDLWNINVSDVILAAVQDALSDARQELGFNNNRVYFNAGVLLINLNKWREQNISTAAAQFVSQNRTKWADQDALNVASGGNWLELPPKWNVQTAMITGEVHYSNSHFRSDELACAINNPAIVHFTGRQKPSAYMSTHPFTHEYYRYLHMTEWRDYQPAKPEFKTEYGLYRFSEGQQIEQFLLSGWSTPEKKIVWTNGNEVLLALGRLPASVQLVRLQCLPFTASDLTGQRVVISVRDEVIATFFVDQALTLRFPVSAAPEEAIVLRLSLPDAVMPRKYGIEDWRTLGLAVQSLELAPFPDGHNWKILEPISKLILRLQGRN
jgi:lipopolysaccharide biosynthesis glycosyltransferase